MKRRLVNLAVLLTTITVTLVALEGAFRVRAYLKDKAEYENKHEFERIHKSEGYAGPASAFGFMTRLSDNDRLVFDLKPHLKIKYSGAMVETNRQGFRDSDYLWEKDADTVRVFGIGDSIMFGQGVPQGQEYLSVLERTLNDWYHQKKWEVINSGVPEYNTAIEVETLKTKGLKYGPDIVVLGFCSNDIDLPMIARFLGLPERIDIGERYLTLSRSFLKQFVARKLDYVKNDMPGLPNKYQALSGGRAVGDSLVELRRLSDREGFDVIVFFLRHAPDRVSDATMMTARELGFHIVDVQPAIRQYMEARNITEYFDSELTLDDGHPTVLGHAIAAEVLLNYMEGSGLLNEHLESSVER